MSTPQGQVAVGLGIHWCSTKCPTAEVRVYNHLFKSPNPYEPIVEGQGEAKKAEAKPEAEVEAEAEVVKDPADRNAWLSDINPESMVVYKNVPYTGHVVTDGKGEREGEGERCQFERVGYFVTDPDSDMSKRKVVFNRIVPLRVSKAKGE
ncbi:hypothetical protein KIPB_002928 [Kipferlia bialata]|uniref:Uncharacterized protein n=1 Tax=Kipferlia bialata TaxID=797122 RepID=A0A391NPY3_9EUKA|nr:hypothetical protein KIPB_002928 [Kipferlia bialata]|eukprot:g2928.t1